MMPIFMIGTQRSGSNLLRLMLNQLPEIAAPHPPHILQRMMPLLANYGDLSDDGNFSLLVDDVCRLVELNPVPWEGVVLDRRDISRRCRERSVPAIHGAVYDVCTEAKGALTWCCKSLANISYTTELEAYFRSPKYIYLYRDGRDVAVSFSKAVVGEKHFYHIAREWAATQELALALRGKIGVDRFLSVSYEELTSYPERTARLICAFLGVPFRKSMLDYYGTDEAKRAAAKRATPATIGSAASHADARSPNSFSNNTRWRTNPSPQRTIGPEICPGNEPMRPTRHGVLALHPVLASRS